jgi:DNA-binding LytR/AlgR family response regulator
VNRLLRWSVPLFAAAGLVLTVLSAASVHVRQHGEAGLTLPWANALFWQGAIWASWIPIGLILFGVLRSPKSVRAALLRVYGLGAAVVPAHALGAAWLDIVMSPSVGPEDFGRLLEYRAPIDLLAYTALVGFALAVAAQRRASEETALSRSLAEALAQARAAPPAPEPERLSVSMGTRRVLVDPAEVEWFASAGNYVVVNWNGREGLIRETLSALEQRLDPAVFARSHRSTIVNLGKVRETASLSDGSWRLVTESGAELVASRTYRDAVLGRLGR